MGIPIVVSVITPFYNTPEQFLGEAIESVLGQTFDAWEMLLVDDGSTNPSTEVALASAQRHPERIRLLRHPDGRNHGTAQSRQLGIEHSRGQYIAFLDADDVWLPTKLAQQVEVLERSPEVGMLYGKTLYWHGWTGDPLDARRDYTPELRVPADTVIEPPRLLLSYIEQRVTIPAMSDPLLRREAAERTGGFTDIGTFMYDDQMLFAKICLEYPVFVAHEYWDKYRLHPRSGTTAAVQSRPLSYYHYIYLQWLASYLAHKDCRDHTLWQALGRQLWLYRQRSWARGPMRGRYADMARLARKWLLRLEERILPRGARRRLWLRTMKPEVHLQRYLDPADGKTATR